ncbi:hypothetical protein ABZY81_29580 [Streptomyces sp. NPDC006514]|uniref:hypothetical protein n=1 Tax=Streptomyces sp. NPDC006514 TaxID=3154308 RepID=UPI0033ACD748
MVLSGVACRAENALHKSLAHRLAQETLPKPHLFARNSSPQPFTLVFPCKSTDSFLFNDPGLDPGLDP